MEWHKFQVGDTVFLTASDREEMENEYKESVMELPFDASDIAEMWSNELEDKNYHSMTHIPNVVLSVLETEITDKETLLRMMQEMKDRIGL